MNVTIRRTCYFPNNRPRVWWWKIEDASGNIVADGFSSKNEAMQFAIAMEARQGGDFRLHPKDDSAGRKASPRIKHD